MKTRTVSSMLTVAAAAVALAAAGAAHPASAAQGRPAPAKPGAPGKKPGGGHRMTPQERAQHEFERLQKVAGKPLSPAQKNTIIAAYMEAQNTKRAADDKFNGIVAGTLHIPVDDLKKRYKAVADQEKMAAAAHAGMPMPGAPHK